MKFSIIVVTYNQDENSILMTLKSIINQTFQDYEIIISDDGSSDNHFEDIERFFQLHKFTGYKLVPHEMNQGTVKNFCSALEYAKGNYVRGFGAGDLFYHEDSLKDLYEYMEKNGCEACFGLLRGYYLNADGGMSYGDYTHPYDIVAYRKKDCRDRILKNLILYGDHVFGAAICYKKDFLVEYLERIEDKVVYLEDIIQVMASLDGRFVHFYDDYVAWYEMKTGVSNRKGSNRSERIRRDFDSFYELIYAQYGDNRFVKKRRKLSFLYKINDLYFRTACRVFFNPDSARFVLNHILQKMSGKYTLKELGVKLLKKETLYTKVQ